MDIQHSYTKYLYKYPQRKFPYEQIVVENAKRGKLDREFQLLDTGIFDEDRYFDCFMETAKETEDDILFRVTAYNRGPEAAPLHIIPQLWFRYDFSQHRLCLGSALPERYHLSVRCQQWSNAISSIVLSLSKQSSLIDMEIAEIPGPGTLGKMMISRQSGEWDR